MALAQRSIKLIISMLDNIKFLVKKYDLDTPSRLREKAYQRFFMYNLLYPMMTLAKIGELFNRDHATVLKGIREARMFEQANDKYYLNIVKDIRKDIIGTGSDNDVQRVTAGIFKNIYDILVRTQQDPFDEVAWEISASVVEMIVGTQQGTHNEFWVSVLNDVEKKVKKSCNVLDKDALT